MSSWCCCFFVIRTGATPLIIPGNPRLIEFSSATNVVCRMNTEDRAYQDLNPAGLYVIQHELSIKGDAVGSLCWRRCFIEETMWESLTSIDIKGWFRISADQLRIHITYVSRISWTCCRYLWASASAFTSLIEVVHSPVVAIFWQLSDWLILYAF